MKVLIIYNKLFHYRIPIFNILSEKCNLTVAYSFGAEPKELCKFKTIKLPVVQFGRFVIHKDNVYEVCQNFDVIIAYGDIAWLKISTLPFRTKRKFKVIFWSLGVSASYKKKYDSVTKWDKIREFFYNKADALVFYTDYPVKKYINRGFNKVKLFVAPNTVEVFEDSNKEIVKDSLLFIGSLYLEKGVLALLENYKRAYIKNASILPLNIIGDGAAFNSIKNWIYENRLEKKIFLRGAIYDPKVKSVYFLKAYACISPLQAGLSVLESMGYGVPFITMSDSITGGERFNIIHEHNGLLVDNISQLEEIIVDISKKPKRYIEMGSNARNYYNIGHKPTDMAQGLYQAIKHVTSK